MEVSIRQIDYLYLTPPLVRINKHGKSKLEIRSSNKVISVNLIAYRMTRARLQFIRKSRRLHDDKQLADVAMQA